MLSSEGQTLEETQPLPRRSPRPDDIIYRSDAPHIKANSRPSATVAFLSHVVIPLSEACPVEKTVLEQNNREETEIGHQENVQEGRLEAKACGPSQPERRSGPGRPKGSKNTVAHPTRSYFGREENALERLAEQRERAQRVRRETNRAASCYRCEGSRVGPVLRNGGNTGARRTPDRTCKIAARGRRSGLKMTILGRRGRR